MSDRPADGTPRANRPRRTGDSRPARQTEAAESRQRSGWYGHGQRTVTEKDSLGLFFDDVAYVFADISILSIPALSAVMLTTPRQWFGVKGAGLVAWTTMVAVAALIRGGWVTPLATDAPGWVALTPWLVLLRLVYYNAALGLAVLAGSAAEAAVSPVASVAVAAALGALGIGLFPRVADAFYGVVSG